MKKNRRVAVNDLRQRDYVYFLTEPMGVSFHPDFWPELTPREMLAVGVFGRKYMTDLLRRVPGALVWEREAQSRAPRFRAALVPCMKQGAGRTLRDRLEPSTTLENVKGRYQK
jgi:hypothetical protein